MKIAYSSPSIIPSKSANSIHVVNQCYALAQLGHSLTLFARYPFLSNSKTIRSSLSNYYSLDFSSFHLSLFWFFTHRFTSPLIFICSLLPILFGRYDLIISRNFFSSLFFSIFSPKCLVIELHQIEAGYKLFLLKLFCNARVRKIVVISTQLKLDLESVIGRQLSNISVCHDATTLVQKHDTPSKNRLKSLLFASYSFINPNNPIVGYVGHLYKGRGIEVILKLSLLHPNVSFLVVGGSSLDLKYYQSISTPPNVFFLGHLNHSDAKSIMSGCDVLLMPYQSKVSIGVGNHDTSRWMSPLKMFEYMSSSTPFISSDLPVLREILIDKFNCLLVPPDDISSWSSALTRLLDNPYYASELASNAYENVQSSYTWSSRAHKLVTQ